MAPPSPTVASWDLAVRLRRRREELGIDVKTLVADMGFSRNYWSAVENDRTVVSAEKLAKLTSFLEFGEKDAAELLALRETAKQRGWWARYAGLFSDDLMRLYGFEHGAQSIRTYNSLLVPGLLQTADYARALMANDISVRPVEVDQRVAVRLARQRRLRGDDPLLFSAVISEAALHQEIGGRDVLSAQLMALAAAIEELPESLDVRVLPFTATAGVLGAAMFSIFDFPSPGLPALAWQEAATMTAYLQDERSIGDLSLSYTEAERASLSAAASLQLIRRRAEETR